MSTTIVIVVLMLLAAAVGGGLALQGRWDLPSLAEVPREVLARRVPRPTLTNAQLRRRVARALTNERHIMVSGTTRTASTLLVRISEPDAETLCPDDAFDLVAADLRDTYLRHAKREGWTIAGNTRVFIDIDPLLHRGSVVVSATPRIPELIHGDSERTEEPATHTDRYAVPESIPEVPEEEIVTARVTLLGGDTRRQDTRRVATPDTGTLVLTGTDGEGTFRITSPTALIGRDEQADVSIGADTVSHRHAEIRHDGQGWAVRDLESTNGTFVDGHPARGWVRLAAGTVIGLGRSGVELSVSRPG